MNHVTFNDPVKNLTSLYFGDDHEKEVSSLLSRKSFEAPLFEWAGVNNDKIMSLPNDFDIIDALSTEPNLLPFKRFRLFVKPTPQEALLGMKSRRWWIHHVPSALTLLHAMDGGDAPDWKNLLILRNGARTIQTVHSFQGELLNRDLLEKYGARPTFQKDLDEAAQIAFTQFCWFVREYTSPQNFVASVTPDKKGKSVEWLQTRTHYVLLNRHHPANDKAVMKGAKVAPGEEYIQRRAHSRRAHARILRSPRFRNKVGQTIRVKACWVGPDEWEQFGSIYRMAKLNPTKTP
jgi:hypothetical protein